jgi:hypothetical protein
LNSFKQWFTLEEIMTAMFAEMHRSKVPEARFPLRCPFPGIRRALEAAVVLNNLQRSYHYLE